MKKKIIIIIICIFSFFCISIIGGGIGTYIWYKSGLEANDKIDYIEVDFKIDQGTSTRKIIDNLYENKLIKDTKRVYIYTKFNEVTIQAGLYKLNNKMTVEEIFEKFKNGEVQDNSIAVTFVEGIKLDNFEVSEKGRVNTEELTLKSYAKTISQNFNYTEEEVIKKLQDREYLQTLIDKYWFLTDEILNDKLYYALEGYLSPNTYYFEKDVTLEQIIEKLLDSTDKILSEYKTEIEKSNYTVHEIITLASIIEREGSNSKDRNGVAGVFYNRIEAGWSLGSDVTTYYGSKVEMADRDLYQNEINELNSYNTRNPAMAGKLPIGPICNPGRKSIEAAIEPTKHDYYFFVADKNGKTYFSKTNAEHINTINNLKQNDLWYEYK